MWSQVQKILHTSDTVAANDSAPMARRGGQFSLDSLAVGQALRFSAACPLPPLSGNAAYIIAFRYYRFGEDVLKSYQLQIGRFKHFFLTIAEDAQGQYLSISRALSELEQDVWFGRDALSFFTEPSTAKSIRCKADMTIEGEWAADRYSKTVDWVEGNITHAGGGRAARSFHYNLLVNATGEKALEIEQDDATGETRVFATVYRPAEDIISIEAVAEIPTAVPAAPPQTSPSALRPAMPPAASMQGYAPPTASATPPRPAEVPLFRESLPEIPAAHPKQRPDFRRQEEEYAELPTEIRIPRTTNAVDMKAKEMDTIPAFLMARDGNYLSLDEVIPPEPERVRVGLKSARNLIERALLRNVRVRDVLRDLLGLDSAISEEVIFELPLSDEDYRILAMRYKLRPDHRAEIRARMEEELRRVLGK